MVEFKTQYGKMEIDPANVHWLATEGNLTVLFVADGPLMEHPQSRPTKKLIVSDSYSEAMRKLGCATKI